MGLQAVVIGMCMVWLADPKHPASPEQAEYLAAAMMVAGAGAVALFPMWRFLSAPFGAVYGHNEEVAAKEFKKRVVERAQSEVQDATQA
jgi:hypothetical protein